MISGKASIIIRTKNEEEWIGHCLEKVFKQDYNKGYEVIIIDNASTDYTLKIASRYPIKKIISIDNYLPGKALNSGIKDSKGEFAVCLSAHCIPKSNSWLTDLLLNFNSEKIAGVYGRQIPISYSNPLDVRDLYSVFGLDKRIQIKDSFFNNANSAIRRSVWDEIPFDEEVSNIEDRLWAKSVIEKGYCLIYEPKAEVYHHHGIYQSQSKKRVEGAFAILNSVEEFKVENSLPESMKPEKRKITAVIPVVGTLPIIGNYDIARLVFNQIKKSNYIKSVFILSNDKKLKDISRNYGYHIIKRTKNMNTLDVTLEDVLKYSLEHIESRSIYPDVILYINPLYPFRPSGLFDTLIEDLCYKGMDTVFAGFADYQNYWVFNQKLGYHQVGEGFLHRSKKHPVYKSLFGLGCASTAKTIRAGKLVGEKIGIVPVEDIVYTFKMSDETNKKIIRLYIEKYYHNLERQ